MANDAKRVSQLGVVTAVSANDRVVVLTNPTTAAQTQSITVSNFSNTLTIPNLVNGSNVISLDANGVLNLPLGIQMGANIEGEGNTGFDIYASSNLAYMGISYGANASNGTASYIKIYKTGPDPITSPHIYQLQIWNGNTNPANSYSNWLFDASVNRFALANNSYIYFSDSTMQYTAFNTNTAYTFSNTITFNSVINAISNSANYIGTLPAANVVSNTQLSSNLANYALLSNGLFTGSVNAASHTVGAAFTANSTLVNANAINVVNQTNTSTLYVTTAASIGTYFTVNSTSVSKTVNASFTGANTYIQNKLQIGNSAGYDFTTLALIEIDASQNTYSQIVMQNANSGTQASGDLVVTADNGNDSFGYVDLGINSSTYSNTVYGITGAGDAYLYSANSQLVIGTASVKDLVFHAGGTAATNRILTVNTTGVTVNSSSNLTVLSNTLNLGTSTNAANGYTYLPNGFKINWGWVSANSSAGNVTFTSPYTTNAYVVTATSNTTVATYQAAVVSVNNTIAAIRTGNSTSTNVFWQAIGY